MLMCKGTDLHAIAAHFGCSTRTIQQHKRHVYSKLRVAGVEQAICKLVLARIGVMETKR